MRVRVATGDYEGAVGQLLGYGSGVGIVVIDGATDAVEIPTEQLERVDAEEDGSYGDPDPTRCEVCGEPWDGCRCPDECQLDHSGPAGSCGVCGR
jgi:hypothetical protein